MNIFTVSVIGSVILAAIIWLVIIFFDRNLLILFGAQNNTLTLAREYVSADQVCDSVFPV